MNIHKSEAKQIKTIRQTNINVFRGKTHLICVEPQTNGDIWLNRIQNFPEIKKTLQKHI